MTDRSVPPPGGGSHEPLFHLAVQAEWRAAQAAGEYRQSTLGRSLDEEGFMHCSFAGQVRGVADAFYRGRDDVVLLRIAADRLAVAVRVEEVGDSGHAFPHLYGPLPLDAVVAADPVPVAPDGRLAVERLLGVAGA
jgi:uncharacterized protein (DUF952 family)